jgi:GNAT superfamily N-acetyltransferase
MGIAVKLVKENFPTFTFEAAVDGKDAGFLDVTFSDGQKFGLGPCYYVSSVTVDPEFRRGKVGTRLYEAAMRFAAAEGFSLCSGHEQSYEAKKFWEKQHSKGRTTYTPTDRWGSSAGRYQTMRPPPPSLDGSKGGPKHTPWGPPDNVLKLDDDIYSVSTPSHGGIFVDKERNLKIPAFMRIPSGWYEEDVDWTLVATAFPRLFSLEEREHAKHILKNWKPAVYEQYYREELPPGESMIKDEALFLRINQNEYIGLAAWGDWHKDVPPGMVVVLAGRGGRTVKGQYPKDTAYFVVPQEEYNERGPFGFVIDPERHERIKFEQF